ncbi:acid-sensing ion channel 5-like [Physella acuta]|uniref:acid-sensing ion channel 5-like n=1 Tax=Physella acuta TaxID=109671 RepID=UPI0027DB31E4|nr:acid-sensing ion channel 5-like [Physella acuta]
MPIMETQVTDPGSRLYIISKQFQLGQTEIVFLTNQAHAQEPMTIYPYYKQCKDEENQLLKCVHVHKSKITGSVDENQELNYFSEKHDECNISSTEQPLSFTILNNKELFTKDVQETRIDIDTATPETKEETFWLEYKAKVKDVLLEFAGETTAHGYKRTTSTRRAVKCRILWAFAILCVVVSLINMLDLVLPDMYAFSTSIRSEPGRSVPFPAVTVCNLAPYDTSRIDGTALENYTPELMHLFTKDSISSDSTVNTSRQVSDTLDTKTLSDLIGWGLDRFLLNCTLFTKSVNCSDIFTRTMSGPESCFSFNFNTENTVCAEQRGSYSSLHLVLDIGSVVDPFSSVTPVGVKVILHNFTMFCNVFTYFCYR